MMPPTIAAACVIMFVVCWMGCRFKFYKDSDGSFSFEVDFGK